MVKFAPFAVAYAGILTGCAGHYIGFLVISGVILRYHKYKYIVTRSFVANFNLNITMTDTVSIHVPETSKTLVIAEVCHCGCILA